MALMRCDEEKIFARQPNIVRRRSESKRGSEQSKAGANMCLTIKRKVEKEKIASLPVCLVNGKEWS